MIKKIELKLNCSESQELEGHAVLSLKSIIAAAKEIECGSGEFPVNTTVDLIVQMKTQNLGVLKLKLTIGLVSQCEDFAIFQDALRDLDILLESNVYWPPVSYYLPNIVIPLDWMTILAASEYVSYAFQQNHLRSQKLPIQFDGSAQVASKYHYLVIQAEKKKARRGSKYIPISSSTDQIVDDLLHGVQGNDVYPPMSTVQFLTNLIEYT